MKYLFFLLSVTFCFSCSQSLEERCFAANNLLNKLNKDEAIIVDDQSETETFDVKKIVEEKPAYLQIINLKNYRSFKSDSIELHENQYSDDNLKWEKHKVEYESFEKKFLHQFSFSDKQQVGNAEYALGRNQLGFWLCKIENSKPSAYFLGLSFSHYYINKVQEKPIINSDFLELEGSLVKIIKVPGLPVYDDYSAIEDGKLFKIKLEDLMKDSDADGYNDIFEINFGLNPNDRDSDGDGVDDFNDSNPMFKSEKNKFTQLYEALLPDYGEENLSDHNYFFEVFISDCDYFHQINPKYHVLFIPEDSKLKTKYTRTTDVSNHQIGKIRKHKTNPDIFYIKSWGNSGMTDYSAEYKNGKWVLEIGGGYII